MFNDSDNSAYEPVHLNSVITSHGTQRLQAFRVDPLSIAQHTRVSLSQFAPDPARGADTRSVPAGRTSVSFDAIAIVDGQLFQLAFLSPQAKVRAGVSSLTMQLTHVLSFRCWQQWPLKELMHCKILKPFYLTC